MDRYLPEILCRAYPKPWRFEGLDGVYLARAMKTGERTAEFAGMCLLITDQSLTPFQVSLRASATRDSVEWMHCRLGNERRVAWCAYRTPRRSGVSDCTPSILRRSIGFTRSRSRLRTRGKRGLHPSFVEGARSSPYPPPTKSLLFLCARVWRRPRVR